MLPMNIWVRASCSARADLGGGWSDTPPITYEHGGAVINMAIKIDGKVGFGKIRVILREYMVTFLCEGGIVR